MRTSFLRHLLAGGALALTALAPHALAAQQPLTFGAWTRFEWFDGVGAVDGAGFSFESLLQTRIRVTDAYFAGDAFDILVDGTPFTQTSGMSLGGGGADRADGESAWHDASLDHAEFVLGAGRHVITLAVREDGGYWQGEGFLRADEIAVGSVVPEPRSLLLLATGLAGLTVALRRGRA